MATVDDKLAIRSVLRTQFLAQAAIFAESSGNENWHAMQEACTGMAAFNADQDWATDIAIDLPIKRMLPVLANEVGRIRGGSTAQAEPPPSTKRKPDAFDELRTNRLTSK